MYIAVEAHILIGRRRIPILPVDTEIRFGLRKCFHSENIRMTCSQQRGNLELIGSEHPRDILCASELAAIYPDIGAVVDAAEIQRHMPAQIIFREEEIRAVPPGAAEGTIAWHGQLGKILPYWICCARNRTQVHAVKRVRISFAGDERGYDSGGHGRGVPARGTKLGSGNLLTRGLHQARRLEHPMVVEE